MNLLTLECAGCTAPLSEVIVEKGVHRCPFCGYVNVLPKPEQTSEVRHHLYNADEELKDYEFERAYNAFAKASELDPSESKAYFGMALATNRIKYIKDVVNNRWQAICCEVSDKKFSEDKNYLRALEHATIEQREEYTSRAEEIDYIREKFAELEKSGLSYDTFICVKVSDENGGFTQDSMWANRLYDSITKSGAKPFYSEKEIGDRTGEDYEALILYALYTAKSMIIVCSNEDYLRTPWVQNEYTRYYAMLNDEDKEKGSIVVAFFDSVIERVPGLKGKLQGISLRDFDASQKINDFVSKFATKKPAKAIKVEEKTQKKSDAQIAEEFKKNKKLYAKKGFKLSGYELKKYKGKDADVQIPEGVTTIAPKAFAGNKKIVSLTIPNTVTTIGDGAFESCESLRSVSVGNSVFSGSGAFSFCKALSAVTLAEGTTRIPKSFFSCCHGLKEIEIPDTVTEIGEFAFESCVNLVKITIPNGVVEIKDGTFTSCYALKEVNFPKALTYIGEYAFTSCESLKKLTLPSTVAQIKESAFSGCRAITELTVPGSLSVIGLSVFSDCKSLKSIVICDGVNEIGGSAFAGCESLRSVEIPSTVSRIRTCAFAGCSSLAEITIPGSITEIEEEIFSRCTSLKRINLGYGIREIGPSAFERLTALREINIPRSVTTISGSAFEGCSSLTKIVIPKSVTQIRHGAFASCSALKTICCEVMEKPSRGWDWGWCDYPDDINFIWGYRENE